MALATCAIWLLFATLRENAGRHGACSQIDWGEGRPLKFLARFILFGEGDIAPTTREIPRQAEPDPTKRPAIHVG